MKVAGRYLRLVVILLGPLLGSLAHAEELPEITIRLGDARIKAEVAATPESRATGLSGRDRLGADRGMLFAWDDAAPRRFWMKDTRIPLSIAFLDERGRILNIHRMAPPPPEGPAGGYRRYRSRGPAQYALEVNRGWFANHGIAAGSRCHFRLPQAILGTETMVGRPPHR